MKTSLVGIITYMMLLWGTQPIFGYLDSMDKRVLTPCQETIKGYCLDTSHHAKRAAQATPTYTHQHSPAFNIIHVIAAVAGMTGILLVGIVSFFMLKRRRQRRRRHTTENDTEQKETTSESNSNSKHNNNQLFAQFAHDFCSSDSSTVPPPSMQQRHLQLELLKQQHTSMNSPIPPPYHP